MKLWLAILLLLVGAPSGAAVDSFVYNRNQADLDGVDR